MPTLAEKFDEARKRALAQAREIAERAAAGEERAEDEEAYTRANADFDKNTRLMNEELKRAADDAESAEALEAALRKAGVQHRGHEDEHEDEPTGWLADVRAALSDKESRKGGSSQKLPDVRRHREVRSLLAPEQRLMDTVTATKGQETIPVTLVESLFRKVFDDSAILSAGVRILRTDSGETMKFPRLTALGALAQTNARRAEAQQIQKSDPTFDQVQLDAYKYAQISQASREVIQDSVIDIEGLLGEVLGRNMANYLGLDLTTGSGTGQPRGVVTLVPAGNKVTSATGVAGAIQNADQLLDVIWKLKPTYRRNAKFVTNDLSVLTLRKFKINGEANNYAFSAGDASGKPDTLMGYPLLTDPNMAVAAVNATSLIFGDFSMYYVRMVQDVRVEWSTEYAWDTDLVSVKAVLRADGDTIDDTAFAAFVGAAT